VSITITADGNLRFIWDDSLAELVSAGIPTISRASHVEANDRGEWSADLNPVGGPVLGSFPLRSEALAAERRWLEGKGY
jgi:hypothetical protein